MPAEIRPAGWHDHTANPKERGAVTMASVLSSSGAAMSAMDWELLFRKTTGPSDSTEGR